MVHIHITFDTRAVIIIMFILLALSLNETTYLNLAINMWYDRGEKHSENTLAAPYPLHR